ncbi:efflux RND transporter permease subunit [Brevibacillus daliensis]|uniref:efflux RND transporter permease subunit n=1 Tax=Brevibacillus daliensis TaxID=2892995 RepID=UPI001E2F9C28|nr:efflux RND transporter permease subunit [Brevibacillus daliensis]
MNNKWVRKNLKAWIYGIVLFILIGGIVAANSLSLQMYPEWLGSRYQIVATYPDLTAKEMDEKVTQPLIKQIEQLSSIEDVKSTTSAGQTSIELHNTNHFDSLFKEELEEKIEPLKASLGESFSITVNQSGFTEEPVALFYLTGMDLPSLHQIADGEIIKQLEQIPGVLRVEKSGSTLANQVELIFRPEALQAYQLTPGDVSSQLQNMGKSEQLGTIVTNEQSTSFLWSSAPDTIEEIGRLPIQTAKGEVALRQFIDVKDMRDEPAEALTIYKGEPTIMLKMNQSKGSSLFTLQQELRHQVELINQSANGMYQFKIYQNAGQELINLFTQLFFIIILVSVLISCWIAYRFRQWRAGLISLIGIFSGLAVIFIGLYLTGIPLHLGSIGPLALMSFVFMGAGVVLFEKYGRITIWNWAHIWMATKSRVAAILLPVVMVPLSFLPLVYSSITDVESKPALLASLPFLAIGIIAVVVSYLYVVPLLASRWLRLSDRNSLSSELSAQRRRTIALKGWMMKSWYKRMQLGWTPYAIAIGVTIILYHSLIVFIPIDKMLLWDRQESTALNHINGEEKLSLPEGTTLAEAVQTATLAEQSLKKIPELRDMYSEVAKEKITLHLNWSDSKSWTRSSYKIKKEVTDLLLLVPGSTYQESQGNSGQSKATTSDVTLTFTGPSFSKLEEVSHIVMERLEEKNGSGQANKQLVSITNNENPKLKQMRVKPKEGIVESYGIKPEEVKSRAEGYLQSQQIGVLREGVRDSSVTISYPKGYLDYLVQFEHVMIPTDKGMQHLKNLAEIVEESIPPAIIQENGLYKIEVSADIIDLPDAMYPLDADMIFAGLQYEIERGDLVLPVGYKLVDPNVEWKEERRLKGWEQNGPLLIFAGLASLLTVLSAFMLKQKIKTVIAVILVTPLALVPAVIALSFWSLPSNHAAILGTMTIAALIWQQGLALIASMDEHQEERDVTEIKSYRGRAGTREYLDIIVGLPVIMLVSFFPFAMGWTGTNFSRSYFAVMAIGMLCIPSILFYMVTAIYRELCQGEQLGRIIPYMRVIRVMWSNWWNHAGVHARSHKRYSAKKKEVKQDQGKIDRDHLRQEDFLPVTK